LRTPFAETCVQMSRHRDPPKNSGVALRHNNSQPCVTNRAT